MIFPCSFIDFTCFFHKNIDRQVVVGYPDAKGRTAIMHVHAKNKPLASDVDLEVIAKTTAGFTGAELENLMNEAALLAVKRNKEAITMDELNEAMIKVVVGQEKKSRKISDKEKKFIKALLMSWIIIEYNNRS